MNRYLIALDMDGTLLKRDQSVSPFTIETIRKVIELGHIVIIASGRPYRNILDTYNLLKLDTPIVAYNGGAIYGAKSAYKDEEKYYKIEDILTVINGVDFSIFENYMCESNDSCNLRIEMYIQELEMYIYVDFTRDNHIRIKDVEIPNDYKFEFGEENLKALQTYIENEMTGYLVEPESEEDIDNEETIMPTVLPLE